MGFKGLPVKGLGYESLRELGLGFGVWRLGCKSLGFMLEVLRLNVLTVVRLLAGISAHVEFLKRLHVSLRGAQMINRSHKWC